MKICLPGTGRLRRRGSASRRLPAGRRRRKRRGCTRRAGGPAGQRGQELLRRLFQDRLDLTAAREERRHDVAGEDGVVRTRADKDRKRPLLTVFGQVIVSRIAYRAPGLPNVQLIDAMLNLPWEKHSHGLASSPRSRLRAARWRQHAPRSPARPACRWENARQKAWSAGPPSTWTRFTGGG